MASEYGVKPMYDEQFEKKKYNQQIKEILYRQYDNSVYSEEKNCLESSSEENDKL